MNNMKSNKIEMSENSVIFIIITILILYETIIIYTLYIASTLPPLLSRILLSIVILILSFIGIVSYYILSYKIKIKE